MWRVLRPTDTTLSSDNEVRQAVSDADSSLSSDVDAVAIGTSTGPPRFTGVDLSVVIPALDEGTNLVTLLPALRGVLASLTATSEIIVVTRHPDAVTRTAAQQAGAKICEQVEPGYGEALRIGFANARGMYALTMDADLSHPPEFIRDLWSARGAADLTIASRYVAGGSAKMPAMRRVLSRVLNTIFRRGLSVRVNDLSSGFRLYRMDVMRPQTLSTRDFDILQQILVQAYVEGWRIREVPFVYAARAHGASQARVFKVGRAYLRTFLSLWKLRNSILAADYDDRAHDSPIWLQRYWQRNRFRLIINLIAGQGPVLDVGCGSSRIISALPPGSVAVDILLRKLRYATKFGRWLVQASGFSLPFPDASFPCVLCSQVIEHVPKESAILDELCRVLRVGGRLVLGTPDYANWQWVYMEKAYKLAAPGGYADEHIAHYTHDELVETFQRRGFDLEATHYILKGELIMAFRKTRELEVRPRG
jgi:dolichol-phosphate mannosyltransferase